MLVTVIKISCNIDKDMLKRNEIIQDDQENYFSVFNQKNHDDF